MRFFFFIRITTSYIDEIFKQTSQANQPTKSIRIESEEEEKMDATICQRCKTENAVVKTRKEFFCKCCFDKFIKLKLRKLLMSKETESIFKVFYDPQHPEKEIALNAPNCKVLLACSFGSSSLTVLYFLIDYLKEQHAQHSKYGFEVEVLTLYSTEQELTKYKLIIAHLRNLDSFQISSHVLKFKLLDINKYFLDNNDGTLLKINNDYVTTELTTDSNSKLLTEALSEAFPTNKLGSSKMDFYDIFQKTVIEKYFNENSFQKLLWGHSMTKVADQVISHIVKGRGSSIAKELETGMYPLTDVFLSEIDAYVLLQFPDDYQFILCYYTPQPTLLLEKDTVYKEVPKNEKTKSTKTINEIARDYFDNIEGEYSNIISTVVRTALKLGTPAELQKVTDKNVVSQDVMQCRVCGVECFDNSNAKSATAWLNNITVHKGHAVDTDEEKDYYKQWLDEQNAKSSKLNAEDATNNLAVSVCYGCTVTLHTSSNKSIAWKKRDDEYDIKNILNEYSLSDNGE